MRYRTEGARLEALRQLDLLDTPASEAFDRIARLAARMFDLPWAAISLTDHDRQWFKSSVGLMYNSFPRDGAPCAAVTAAGAPLALGDLRAETSYATSAYAQAGIRSYAGAPLVTGEGFVLGAICVMGPTPRAFSDADLDALRDLAGLVMAQVALHNTLGRLDSVSLMPNRAGFIEDLEDLGRDPAQRLPRIAVLADLATAEQLSNGLRVRGPAYLDEIVQRVGRIIQSAIGPRRRVYHVAATQFAFLAPPGVNEVDYIKLVATTLAAIRTETVTRLFITTAIGMAPFVPGEADPRDLLRMAHNAAQDARRTEGKVCIYSPAEDTAHHRRFALIDGFGAALEAQDQLRLVYQPRIDLASGACVGAEALLRWRHPQLGEVSPGEFMPLIEQTTMAWATTSWVLETALRQLAAWHASGVKLRLSVNLSATNLLESDVVEHIAMRLAQQRLPADCLELELTETAVMQDAGQALTRLEQLSTLGVHLAIDDFGTGYSSLSYLQRLPVHVVKIDQSFLRDIAEDDRKRALVTTMIGLSHDLGYRVVAEGVETRAALELVEAAGCDEAQGFLFARPMPADHFVTWLKEWVSPRISPIEPQLPRRSPAGERARVAAV
jgi:EAL domain-containing protein (putative c-di-GMP-specific phosphodiesterase class I)/GGDEF domain-containing protein